MEKSARLEAQKQWNARACGELPGDKQSLAYFEAVARDRYIQQPWMHNYFRFQRFSGRDVLEIGIGQGTDMMQFAKSGARCHGVDITENHLKLTARNATVRGYDVDLQEIDATTLPFPDESIDCVYSFGVLHHIPEIEKVISEIRRVLKPNGRVMIALYNQNSAFYWFKCLLMNGLCRGWLFTKGHDGLLATIETGADGVNIKPYVKLYTKKSVRELMEAFDMEDVSVHQLYLSHFMPSAVAKRLGFLENLIKPFESRLGWYVAYQGVKPSVVDRV
jgi:ubiquinone/menaquinone biosynthesis C-methylase UbiE